MQVVRGTVVLAVVCGLAGCGASNHDQVRSTLQRFTTAVASRDANAICNQVLAPSLLVRFPAAGLTCQQAMGVFFTCNVKNPKMQIGPITINRGSASAIVYSEASGQRKGIFQLGLEQTSQGWRIASEAAEKGGAAQSC
jgi:hypothetical protein